MREQTVSEPFWERSWKEADKETIAAYADQFQPDREIISYLKAGGAVNVCDAGCGCGAFALALAANGFRVSGFDISADAVALAQSLLTARGCCAQGFRVADVRATGYDSGAFDAVVARDVIDHLPRKDGIAAIDELLRIVKPGGCVLLSLDKTDDEYETEPHMVSPDGDYLFTEGKWDGMVFHPYSPEDIEGLTQGYTANILVSSESGYIIALEPTDTMPGKTVKVP